MALPWFYINDLQAATLVLDEDTSKHVVQVLRMQTGEELLLTDGKGTRVTAIITNDNRKRCEVNLQSSETEKRKASSVTIAISLIKNTSRFEWFLEKATEIGVTEIIPLLCERTEKEKFRYDRLNNIVVSAMLQSQQCWLPQLYEPTTFDTLIESNKYQQKFIAHCKEGQKKTLFNQLINQSANHLISPSANQLINQSANHLILIGPEGDFTEREVKAALNSGFQPVSLGRTRLRTETAGMVAAVFLTNST